MERKVPAHYPTNPEPIDVVQGWNLPYTLGCVVKYLARYRCKGDPLGDLEKAKAYLEMEIEYLRKCKSLVTDGMGG